MDIKKELTVILNDFQNSDNVNYDTIIENIIILIQNYKVNELKVLGSLLDERNKLLEVIPKCEIHGACIPHAIDWIEKMKASERAFKAG